jgi:ATP-binding cassette subfamily B protein
VSATGAAGPGTWRLAARLAAHRPVPFWVGTTAWVLFFCVPLGIGLLLEAGFDRLSSGDTGPTVYWIAAAIAAAEVVRIGLLWVAAIWFTRTWTFVQSLLRLNLLRAQLASGGDEAGPPVASPAGALSHFRDDTQDVMWFIDGWLDLLGAVLFTVAAAVVLAAIDPWATAVVAVPMVAVGIVTQALDRRIKAYRMADREATGALTGFLGDALAAVLTVQLNDAGDRVLTRVRARVDARRRTAVRDRVLEDGLVAFGSSTTDVGLALVLLVAAGSLRSGAMTVGELAVFSAYVVYLGFLPRTVGHTLARRRQAAVAFERMRRLVADGDTARLVVHRPLPLDTAVLDPAVLDPAVLDTAVLAAPRPPRPVRVPLQELVVTGLGADHPDGRPALRDVSFRVRRGSFTVVTGPVGAGKTTLLRALLGLVPTTGSVRWNGVEIVDRAAFCTPPNVAYLSQVPHLLSDSLADNVLLGGGGSDAAADGAALADALVLAALDDDVASMPRGPATPIGPRGVRLSGGQRQRVGAARALVHAPELVVLDDVSSALDVATEVRLWENLAAAGMTVLVVSHRHVARERADQVLVLEHGRLVDAARP